MLSGSDSGFLTINKRRLQRRQQRKTPTKLSQSQQHLTQQQRLSVRI